MLQHALGHNTVCVCVGGGTVTTCSGSQHNVCVCGGGGVGGTTVTTCSRSQHSKGENTSLVVYSTGVNTCRTYNWCSGASCVRLIVCVPQLLPRTNVGLGLCSLIPSCSVRCCFTSTETIRTIRDREPRTATLLSHSF